MSRYLRKQICVFDSVYIMKCSFETSSCNDACPSNMTILVSTNKQFTGECDLFCLYRLVFYIEESAKE